MKTQKTRIAVLVSGGGTNLQALLDAQSWGKIPSGEIVLVVSNKEKAFALERAEKAGIEALAIVKNSDQQDFETRLHETLTAHKIDMVVLAGFLAILTGEFTKKWEKRIINIHPSLIPSFCGEGFYGLRVHRAALDYGVKVTGATVHFVNEIPDGGEILLQKAVEILPSDTPEILQRRVMEQAEWVLLPCATQMVAKRIQEGAYPYGS